MSSVAAVEPQRAAESIPVGHTPAAERVQSIDVLRGFDMFWISGADELVHSLALATGWIWAAAAARELEHSRWQGCTCYDLIQPLFLFITGLTLPLMVGRRLARGQTRWQVFRRLAARAGLLVILGHFDKNGALTLDFAHWRFTGVLERIGMAGWAAGTILLFAGPRAQVRWVVGILAAYWALLTFVTAPGQASPSYEQGRNIVDYLDQHLMPGRLMSGNHDANGWCSTPPVVATVLLGALAGAWLVSARPIGRKLLGLAAAGAALAGLGWVWGLRFPIIKHIWTSSYVLYAAGWSCLLLALFYLVIDGLRWRRWAFPFLLIGMNPLVIYILISTKWVDFPYLAKFFLGFAWSHADPAMARVAQDAATILVEFAFLYWLYRRRWFWRV